MLYYRRVASYDCEWGKTRYLDEGINVSDRWDVVWDVGSQPVLQLYRLRRVPRDVRKQLSYLVRYVQIFVFRRVVGTGDDLKNKNTFFL